MLEDVSSRDAAARPRQGGHSLWELVLHLTAWADTWRRRLEGQVLGDPDVGDFPPVSATTPEAWADARARLEDAHEKLTERVACLTPAELDAIVPGCEYDARFLVRGAIRHTVYHSGQIALLKKAAGTQIGPPPDTTGGPAKTPPSSSGPGPEAGLRGWLP